MAKIVFVAVCLCLGQLSLAITGADMKDPHIYDVVVMESAAPGYIISNIPQVFQRSQVPAPESLNISQGNKDDRFSLKNDTGDLRVKRYLNYVIDSKYELTLTDENNQVVLVVIVSVEDDPAYPPVFNPACYMPPRNTSITHVWPFTVSVKTLLSKPLMLVGGDDAKDASVVIDNDQCDVKAFVSVKNGKVDDIDRDFKPSFSLRCTNTQSPPRGMPDIQTYWNASYHRPDDRGINPDWFVDSPDDPHKRHVLVTLDMKNFYGLDPSIYNCRLSFDLGFLGATVSGNVTIDPIGCPDGFHGGHCNETCVCQNGGSCHPFNGACKCPDRWIGRACDIVSTPYRHFLHGKQGVYIIVGSVIGVIALGAVLGSSVVYVIKRRERANTYVSDTLVDSESFRDNPLEYTEDEYVPDVIINNAG
ncbi:MEGF11 [Branchiostoma lanceolatum]|uniref:MEGF11 protein n=1 Tax=Branchiostoma lanceolatum TaxID=7740 RepID=A0A8J9ZD94_BRALA|nr:MEGF11 [Branchiostoma lanceolatum]